MRKILRLALGILYISIHINIKVITTHATILLIHIIDDKHHTYNINNNNNNDHSTSNTLPTPILTMSRPAQDPDPWEGAFRDQKRLRLILIINTTNTNTINNSNTIIISSSCSNDERIREDCSYSLWRRCVTFHGLDVSLTSTLQS